MAAAIRAELTPRHVPDELIEVPGVPHTRTGKRLEIPVKRLLAGADPAKAVNLGTVDDPALIQWFIDYSRTRARTQGSEYLSGWPRGWARRCLAGGVLQSGHEDRRRRRDTHGAHLCGRALSPKWRRLPEAPPARLGDAGYPVYPADPSNPADPSSPDSQAARPVAKDPTAWRALAVAAGLGLPAAGVLGLTTLIEALIRGTVRAGPGPGLRRGFPTTASTRPCWWAWPGSPGRWRSCSR